MAFYSNEVHGITSINRLANFIIADLANNGYSIKSPSSFVAQTASSPGTTKAILEASNVDVNTVGVDDPGGAFLAQPWRICIEAESLADGTPDEALNAGLRIYAGTSLQLHNDGTISNEYIDKDGNVRKSGELSIGRYSATGKKLQGEAIPFFSYDGATRDEPLFGQTISDVKAHPISYRITITDHGVALFVWLEASDNQGDKFSWMVIQHLSDVAAGTVNTASKCPVFCLYSTGGGDPTNLRPIEELALPSDLITKYPNIYRFTVREADVLRPTFPINACIPNVDNTPVINPFQQVSIYENKTFALTMPNGFNTDRYAYKEEMDLVLYTSADVISQWNQVSLSMFGKTRTYTAMQANLPNNSGMRMLVLTKEV